MEGLPIQRDFMALAASIDYTAVMSDAAQWHLTVSRQTDRAIRDFLADSDAQTQEDLSSFVEDAVKARLFDLSVAQARRRMAHLSAEEIETLVDDAVDWARRG